jgi:hypothetical protein
MAASSLEYFGTPFRAGAKALNFIRLNAALKSRSSTLINSSTLIILPPP